MKRVKYIYCTTTKQTEVNMFVSLSSLSTQNNPNKKGEKASPFAVFGECSRYKVCAVHTRFDSVSWFVFDAEQTDCITGRSLVIKQESSLIAAIKDLTLPCERI